MARIPKHLMRTPAFKREADKAFSEVYEDEPESVTKSGKVGKEKQAMMTAIALSKSRAALKKGK